jgi:hypothetical protein
MHSDAQSTPNKQFVRPDPMTVGAKKREIAVRYRKGKESFSMAKQRVAELRRLFVARYGNELPDDDAGRDDAKLAIDHIASRPDAKPEYIETFLRQWCPWMGADEIEKLTADALAKPLHYCADTLAERLAASQWEQAE